MTARQLPNGLIEVDSEASDQAYIIDLGAGTCSCPDFTYRQRRCKHFGAADALVAQEKAKARFSTASRVPDALLPVLLERHAEDPTIQTALLYERERRRRREEENAKMLAVFR
jgi:SWIM zinc finger